MRKSKKEKQKRNSIIAGIVLTFLMVSSIMLSGFLGVGGNQNKRVLRINGEKYVFNVEQNTYGSNYYNVEYDNQNFISYSLPNEYTPVMTDGALDQIRNYPNIYVTFDPNDTKLSEIEQIRYDLTRSLPSGKIVVESMTGNSSEYSLPIIDCYNADFPVIYLKSSNITEIKNDGSSCIEVYFSEDPNQIRSIRDTLVFSLWGIEIDG